MSLPSSTLDKLNDLLDAFIPMAQKANAARAEAIEKEAAALEKILSRVWLVMPYFHAGGEPGRCVLINKSQEIPTGPDGGLLVSNVLELLEDGPRLIRTFSVSVYGNVSPIFEIKDEKETGLSDAIKTYGFEDICGGLIEMLQCQNSVAVELTELQTRIERVDSVLSALDEKFKLECLPSERTEVLQ